MPLDGKARATIARTALAYIAMVGVAILLFLWIREQGRALTAPAATGLRPFGPTPTAHGPDVLLHVLLALVVIIVAARIVGALFRRVRQPRSSARSWRGSCSVPRSSVAPGRRPTRSSCHPRSRHCFRTSPRWA